MGFTEELMLVIGVVVVGLASSAMGEEPSCPPNHDCDCSVTEGTLHIECNAMKLDKMPDLTPFLGMPISLLLLEANDIPTIPPDAFSGLVFKGERSHVPATIDVSENPLITLHEHTFRGVQADSIKLRAINCSLNTFPKQALQELVNLTSLYLHENDLRELPKQPFKMLSSLQSLDLSSNNVGQLADDTFEGVQDVLKAVYLNNMGLVQFPSGALSRLKTLQTVEVEDNRIAELGDHILKNFQTTKALTLKLNKNRLGDISKEAFGNTKVSILRIHLHFNRLTNLNWTNVCTAAFSSRTTIDVLGNPIQCNCALYQILTTRPFHIEGECNSEVDPDNQYNGLDIALRHKKGTDFKQKGKEECSGVPLSVRDCSGGQGLTPQGVLGWSVWLCLCMLLYSRNNAV